jgi:hypothetical protein
MLFDYYKANSNCIITKIQIYIKVQNKYICKDITDYKNKSTMFFLFILKTSFLKEGLESSHYEDVSSNVKQNMLVITTLNETNIMPILTDEKEFIMKMFKE